MEDNVSNLQNYSDLSVDIKVGLVCLVPDWCRHVLTVYMIFIFVTGLPGNIIVIIVQATIKSKSSTDWFVTFLAICDVMTLTVCVPVYIIITTELWPNIGSTSGCRFHNLVLHFTFITSIVLIVFIGLDRLWKINQSAPHFTPNKAFNTAIAVFGFSMILGIMLAFCTRNNILGHCIYDASKQRVQLALYLVIIAIIIMSSIVIFYSYVRILITVKSRMKITPLSSATRNSKMSSASLTEKQYGKAVRITKLMFLVTIVFIVSAIIPAVSVVGLTSTDYRNNGAGRIVMFFLTRLYLVNNCTNPYFYIWFNHAFRKRTVTIFKNFYLLC